MRTQRRTYLGIDNGVSGTLAILSTVNGLLYHGPMPVRKELSYTKEKKNISRVMTIALHALLESYVPKNHPCFAIIERPMVNPQRFTASLSAVRALEATLIVLEQLAIPHQYIDSREWQKAMLPTGLKGDALKPGAVDVARRLFPTTATKDADSILIAEYARRKGF